MAGLYIHIPFCKRLCGYCDFFKTMSLRHCDDMVVALKREMEYRRDFFDGDPLTTIYIGGGTPTVYDPQVLQGLIDRAVELWGDAELGEITVEANPDDLTPDYLARLRQTRINRLSIGIQSFIDRDLQFMNRRHSAEQAIECVKEAQRAGFDNITIDLIYGVPGMSNEEWRRNIVTALDLEVQHISAYHLGIEPGTLFGKRGVIPVDEQTSEEQYLMLHRMMEEAGYEHYEISNFARSGRRAQHNSSYWHGVRYLGVGPSAHSYDGACRWWVESSIGGYIKNVGSDVIYESELLDEADCYEEYLMLNLRCAEGVNKREIERRFGEKRLKELLDLSRRFVEAGILIEEAEVIRFDRERWLVSDWVISELFGE
ncbi:MAG: radical SAM family heme chaperone HemW [Tidjanibacter sp.]|nr:radical SAM family heme chaperone HemW [Tidjanibacter sp.]